MNGDLIITGIQTSLVWEDRDANLGMIEEKIEQITRKTEIILLPEMFSTGFSMNPAKLAENMEGRTVNWMRDLSARKKIILGGSVIIEDDGLYYNRFIWMLPNGQFGYYDKRHRFAFAGEDEHYTAGVKRCIASVKGWRVNLQVCYDLRFPVWSRQQTAFDEAIPQPEYDLLVYVANWPEKRINAWKTLLQARAIENQCYVAGINRTGTDGNGIVYTGESMVIDPLGEVLYHKKDEEDVFTLSLSSRHLQETREKFPFWKDADQFIINN